jgi:hypothetical protein
MWKTALVLVALVVAGHFAVPYLRTNPLAPVFEGGELVVATTEHEVRFSLRGPVEGTYLVARAERQDFGDEPVNGLLSVVGLATAREYLRAHPTPHAYGSASEFQVSNLSSQLAVIAANRIAYGDLVGLIDRYEDRAEKNGEWVCFTVSGDALELESAESLASGVDATASFERRTDAKRLLLATRVSGEDCEETLGGV